MAKPGVGASGFVLPALLGGVVGAMLVIVATRAIPRMMSRMMSGIMAQMSDGTCTPAEM